jgi:hypothetical protein
MSALAPAVFGRVLRTRASAYSLTDGTTGTNRAVFCISINSSGVSTCSGFGLSVPVAASMIPSSS